jgi:hypothetical protein
MDRMHVVSSSGSTKGNGHEEIKFSLDKELVYQ